MPVNLGLDFQQLSGTLIAIISILSAIGIAVWIALTIWTFRDMKARSRDTFGQLLAALVVAVLSIPGFLVYLILRPRETLAEQYERALEEEALLQEIENRKVCPGCGHAIKDNWRICPYCHTKLMKECTNCGELLELPWKICPYCEVPQMEESRPSRRQRSQAQTYVPSFDDLGGE